MSTDIRELREEVRKLKIELQGLRTEVSGVNSLLTFSLQLNRRLSGNEDFNTVISTAQRAISVVTQLQVAYMALQTARMAAGDPFAWVSAGVAGGAAVLSLYDVTGR